MTMPPTPMDPNAPPPPGNPHAWELSTSTTNAFTVVVPRGWFRDLQQRQTGQNSFVRWAVVSSPDSSTTIITADPEIPSFVTPGAPGIPGQQPAPVVMDPAPAEQWAQTYLNFNLGQRPDFQITNQQPCESMLSYMRKQRDDGAATFSWDSAAEVTATYTEGAQTKSVIVLAWTGGGDMGEWTARAVRIISSRDAAVYVPTALKVVQSLELTPGERLRQGFSGENKAWLGAWGKKAARGFNKVVEDIGGNKQGPPPGQQGYGQQPPAQQGYGQQPAPPGQPSGDQPRT